MTDEHPYRQPVLPRPTGAVACPQCKLLSPATSMRCDCGWSFDLNQFVAAPPPQPGADRNQRETAGEHVAAGLILAAVATVVSVAAPIVNGQSSSWYGVIIAGALLAARGWRRRRP